MKFIVQEDVMNHQYRISIIGTNIVRFLDYKYMCDDKYKSITNEMLIEYRQEKLNELLK